MKYNYIVLKVQSYLHTRRPNKTKNACQSLCSNFYLVGFLIILREGSNLVLTLSLGDSLSTFEC
jgi:predicted sulfurtransferase